MTTTDKTEFDPWPKTPEEVTVDRMLAAIGSSAQMSHLMKMKLLADTRKDRTPEQYQQHLLHVMHEIAAVGLMGAIRTLREIDPDKALEFARDYWEMCEDGSEFGPLLWEWLAEAGVDPESITLDEDEKPAAVTE